jgi:hypothetical protein
MANERNTTGRQEDPSVNRLEQQSSVPNDLPDSKEDREKLRSEETTIDLPDVKDIPGQEFVHVLNPGEMADTTISSADEEGLGIRGLDETDSENLASNTDFDVRPDEREALRDTTYMPTRDEDNLRQARMDNVDFEGEALNEESFGEGQALSAAGLDIPDEVDETRTDAMGQGDEENKDYSLEDTDRDQPAENRTGA